MQITLDASESKRFNTVLISVTKQATFEIMVLELPVLKDVEPGFVKDVVFKKVQGEEKLK